ncbi:chitinase 2-like [Cicer arietinum]|uniref:Chitinase 2-like n=1 Tax=Cicer arietinum TaxID=3827 RepID=A0A1S2YF74_CICAR|nr:chitinase 2-like [Cicer arietinum]
MPGSRQINDSDVKPIIFREYIGVKPYPNTLHDFPVDIINSNIDQFHFILGFAIETYDDNGNSTGFFHPYWNVHFFSPEKVKKLKQNYDNVKVVISIGGRDDKHPFHPASKVDWADNAVNSLKKIIQQYNKVKDPWSFNIIDGIDINYEYIKSDGEDFAYCVGDVIKRLKEDIDVSIDMVSIAPSKQVNSKYHTLYLAHADDIDWVDYQFYFETLKSKDEFKNLFLSLSDVYGSKIES